MCNVLGSKLKIRFAAIGIFIASVSIFSILIPASKSSGADLCSPESLTKLKSQPPTCNNTFALLRCTATPKTITEGDLARLVPKSSPAVTADVVEPLRRERDRLRSQLLQDFKEIEASLESAARSNLGEALSPESVQISKKMVEMLANGMKRNGFDVEIRRQKSFNQIHQGVIYEVPERDVLVIRKGKADGPLARELERFEKYVANRRSADNIPTALKAAPQEVYVDPLFTLARDSLGFFSSSNSLGTGMHLAPGTLFNSQEAAVEIIRHELRHLKVYFDHAGDESAPYRFFVRTKKTPFEGPSSYQSGFAFDEVEGFLSNLKSVQAKLGKETEAYRKQLEVLPPGSEERKKTLRAFRKSLEKTQKEARYYADTIESFINHSYTSAAEARRVLADPAMSPAKFESMIEIQEYSTLSDQTSVDIFLNGSKSDPDRVMNVRVPKAVADKGADAIRDFTVRNLVSIDSLLLSRRLELQVRRADVLRPTTDRLPTHLRPTGPTVSD